MKRVSARAILFDATGRVCLIRRVKRGVEYWVFPGGGMEEGETLVGALRREVLEEVGSTITDISPEPVMSLVTETQEQHFFSCREVSRGEPTGDEHLFYASEENVYDVQFVSCDRLAGLDLKPNELKTQLVAFVCG